MPDKLTDNEILNAAECCTIGDCRGCFYGDTDQRRCRDDLIKNLVDLINRLQAENERLTNLCHEQNTEIDRLIKIKNRLLYNLKLVCEEKEEETIKAEAYKEVFEKLNKMAIVRKIKDLKFPFIVKVVTLHDINTLKNEMIGE